MDARRALQTDTADLKVASMSTGESRHTSYWLSLALLANPSGVIICRCDRVAMVLPLDRLLRNDYTHWAVAKVINFAMKSAVVLGVEVSAAITPPTPTAKVLKCMVMRVDKPFAIRALWT